MNSPFQQLRLLLVALLLGGGAIFTASAARAAAPADGGPWFHWDFGLTYASGINKVIDQMQTNFGVDKDYVWPIGLRFSGSAQYASGWGFGGTVGPWEVIEVKEYYYNNGGRYDDDHRSYNYILPLTVDARYYMSQQVGKPYLRVGVTFPVSGGDYIGSGKAGPVIAIGGEFWQGRAVSLGLEAGYDGSKVEVKGDAAGLHPAVDVTAVGFTATFFVRF